MTTAGSDGVNKKRKRVAVVTGGSAGIGQAYAVRLAKDEHLVAVADIAPAKETERLVREAGGEFFSANCDVSNAASVAEFAGAVRAKHGSIDILVHNAGIYPVVTFDQTDWPTWRRIMDVNLDSGFHLTKAVLPGMREAGWGRIVMVASTTFHLGLGLVAYTASKGALIGFVRSLAAEIGGYGITINAVAPGLVRTPGTTSGAHGESMFEMARSSQAIKRTQMPEDLVGAVSFLVSDEAAFMTGQTLVIDGGGARA